MKLIVLLYLEDDRDSVAALLANRGVVAYSELAVEGHGSGVPGWYGDVNPYESRMVFTMLPDARADDLMKAVGRCTDCEDPRHPIHALQLAVERTEESGSLTEAG